jgi:hypothetical protein
LQAVTLLLDHALSMCLTPFSPSLLRNGLIDRLDGSYAKKRFSPGLHKPYPKPRGARRRRREDKERDGEKICRWIAPPSLIFMMTEDTLLCLAGLGCFSLRPNILGIGHAPPQTPTNPTKRRAGVPIRASARPRHPELRRTPLLRRLVNKGMKKRAEVTTSLGPPTPYGPTP